MKLQFGLLSIVASFFISFSAVGKEKSLLLTFGYDNVAAFPWVTPEQQDYVFQLLKLVDDELPELDFKFKGLPWKRCIEELEAGTLDGCFSTAYTPERAQKGLFPRNVHGELDTTRSLFRTSYSLMVPISLKPKLKIRGLIVEGWNMKHPLGINKGYAIAQDLEPLGYNIEYAGTTEGNKLKLLSGRVMGLADVTSRLEALKKTGDMVGFEILTPPMTEKEFYLILSRVLEKREPQITEKIWNKIAEIRSRKAVVEPASPSK